MRVKRGVASHHKHVKIRQATKGMQHSRRRSLKLGRQGIIKALQYATRDRKNRKRTFRSLWNTRVNAAARENGTTYSRLIKALSDANIMIDRKILSELAVKEPFTFSEIVKKASK